MGILNCFHHSVCPPRLPYSLNLATIAFTFAVVRNYFNDAAISIDRGSCCRGSVQFLIQIPSLVERE